MIGGGHILQTGSRQTVFNAPNSLDVAALLGIPNTHQGTVLDTTRLLCEGIEIHADTHQLAAGASIAWSVRPERITVNPSGRYQACVLDEIDLGHTLELTIALGETLQLIMRTNEVLAETRGTLRLDIPPRDISVWRWESDPSLTL